MCAPFLRLGIEYEYPDLRGFAETKHPAQSAIKIGKMYSIFLMKKWWGLEIISFVTGETDVRSVQLISSYHLEILESVEKDRE